MAPFVSVIIPNLNGREHLAVCLGSLRLQSYQDFEVIVVDNGSVDGSLAFIEQNFPEVITLALEKNLGFTGAGNAGYTKSKGTIIVLLNNDTETDPEWLAAIVSAFERHPRAGSVASKIMLYERRDRFHTAGDYYRVDGIPGNRGVWQEDRGQFDQEERVFSACGGAAAYRRSMVEEIGFLDDRFYFSCEDVDMGWRIHLAGWQVWYEPKAVVYHKLKATGGSETGSYYDGRNFLFLIWKNYPTSLLRQNWAHIFRAQLRITKAALLTWRGPASRARLRGQIAGLLGLYKFLPDRREVQKNNRLSDDSLTALLTPVDESQSPR